MKAYLYILLLLIGLLSSCLSSKPRYSHEGIINNIVLIEGEKKLRFTYLKNNIASVYDFDLFTQESKRRLTLDSVSTSKHTLSKDGKYLLYIEYKKDDEKIVSVITRVDIETQESEDLFSSSKLIVNVVLSPIGDIIYFITAASFGNSSPIATPNFRGGMDVFSYNLQTKEIKRETNFSAIAIFHLELDSTGNKLFFSIPSHSSESSIKGPYMLNLNTKQLTHLKPNNYISLAQNLYPKLKTVKSDEGYFTYKYVVESMRASPTYFTDKLLLLSNFDIHLLDIQDKQGKFIYSIPMTERTIELNSRLTSATTSQASKYFGIIHYKDNSNTLIMISEDGKVENEIKLQL